MDAWQPYPRHHRCAIFTLRVSQAPAARLHWMSNSEIPLQMAGAITIALIVVLGIFVYPALLAHRYGPWIVAVMTLLLGALFVVFQAGPFGGATSLYSLGLAAVWALGPVIAGVIVRRIQRNSEQGSPK